MDFEHKQKKQRQLRKDKVKDKRLDKIFEQSNQRDTQKNTQEYEQDREGWGEKETEDGITTEPERFVFEK